MGQIKITPEALATSAAKYRSDLIAMPVIGVRNSVKHMSMRKGIRYKETVGEMGGSIEIGPYDEDRMNKSDVGIAGRELETHLGSVWDRFSPNSVYQSIYGNSILMGDALKGVPIARAILGFLMKKMGQSLNKNLWSAVRNAQGKKTKDLFDGFDTITTKEIASGGISVAKQNLFEFTEAIDGNNAVELLKQLYRGATDELQGDADEGYKLKMFISKSIYDAYVDDYQQTVGPVVYNKEFDKTYLEGSKGQCELVPLVNKKNSDFIHLSPNFNMLVGVDQMSDTEKLAVEKYTPFKLDLVATMFFGTQFESISPERLLVGKLFKSEG